MTDLIKSALENQNLEEGKESSVEESEIAEEEGSADQNGEGELSEEQDEDLTGSDPEEKNGEEQNDEDKDQEENQRGKEQEEDQRQTNLSEKEETTAKQEEEAEHENLEGNQEASLKQGQRWELVWVREQNIWDFHLDIYIRKWVCVKSKEAGGQERSNPTHNRFTFPKPEEKKSVSKLEASSKQPLTSSEISVASVTGQRSSVKSKGVGEKPSSGNQPKKEYICKQPNCEKIFPDHQTLKKHMLAHGDKQHICQVEGCGKRFVDNSKLRRHQLVHTGERPYSCEICGKTFSLDFNLKTHLRTHTGEKPYACKFAGCDKRFTQSSNLTAHEKCHSFKEEP